MKRTIKYFIGVTCSFAALFSCTQFDEQEAGAVDEKADKVVFMAVTEAAVDTRTFLSGEMGEQYRQVLWQPGDEIALFCEVWNDRKKFINTEIEESSRAAFEGEISEGHSSYYGLYPYSENIYQDGNNANLYFSQRKEQSYRNNSFNSGSMPMACKAGNNQELYFYALGGVLAINLTGSETVKSLSFTGYDEYGKAIPVAGDFYADMNSSDYPVMVSNKDGNRIYSVTLDCGDGVTLNETTPTAFYIVLPVGTYNSFKISINTSDGKGMIKNGVNPLTIRRANVTKAGSFTFVGEVGFNLSNAGHANSYIVTSPGFYSIDGTIIGNGNLGLITGADFHTSDVTINPASAELLWDSSGAVSGVSYSEGKINFVVNDTKGNALIAAKDTDGTILWSWHIWVTEQPEEHIYRNSFGEFPMLDRNLGAVRADRGTSRNEWYESLGLVYQWGRKDPFLYKQPTANDFGYSTESATVPLREAIAHPNTFYTSHTNWHDEDNLQLWSSVKKTIYDPCPAGYTVANINAMRSFTKTEENVWENSSNLNVAESFVRGWDFIYDGTNTAYYPNDNAISYNGNFDGFNYDSTEGDVELWTSESVTNNTNRSRYFRFFFYDNVNCGVSFDDNGYRSNGYPVRCMKDANYEVSIKPDVIISAMSDITVNSVRIETKVINDVDVTDFGIVYGTQSEPTIENGTVIRKYYYGANTVHSFDISGLESATKYYVRAFATNQNGIKYSAEQSFNTRFNEGSFNLSENGTANCYIIPLLYGEYSFDASEIGNGSHGIIQSESFHTTDPAIDPADAKIIWQDGGNIIEDLSLTSDKRISFTATGEKGNALIGVMDGAGTIIWSWHIWATDQPQEELYVNDMGRFTLLDRNLGATRADRGTGAEWEASIGLAYQWGRKDPLRLKQPEDGEKIYTTTGLYMTDVISKPESMIYGKWRWLTDSETWSHNFWSAEQKTIYDPCPVGYRVAVLDAWCGFTKGYNADTIGNISAEGSFDHGFNFYIDGENTAWYPANFKLNYWGDLERDDNECYGVWSATVVGEYPTYLSFRYGGYYDCWVHNSGYVMDPIYGCPVRCMKDE